MPRHKQNEALARLVICGPIGAATVAGALDGTGAEQDTVTLGRFYADVDRWRDATIMSAAIRIARDGTASTQARVFAIRHLVWLAVPGAEYTYGSLIASPVVTPIPGGTRETRTCRHGFSSAHDNAFGTPLPGDYRAQLDAVFAQLDADSTQPVAVRNAARCGRE